MPEQLERMLLSTAGRGRVACLVVDVLASWAVPVAERCGVPAAGFWPAMLASYRAVAAIPELLRKGVISESGTIDIDTMHTTHARYYSFKYSTTCFPY